MLNFCVKLGFNYLPMSLTCPIHESLSGAEVHSRKVLQPSFPALLCSPCRLCVPLPQHPCEIVGILKTDVKASCSTLMQTRCPFALR